MNLQGNVGQVVSGALSGKLIKSIGETNKALGTNLQEKEDVANENVNAAKIAQQTLATDIAKSEVPLMRLNRLVAARGHLRELDKSIDLWGMRSQPIEAKVRVGGNKGNV